MGYLAKKRSLLKKAFGDFSRPEWLLLFCMGCIAMFVWGFIEVADEVLEGESAKVDRQILLTLRTTHDVADPIGPRWVEEAARDITALGSWGVLAIVVTLVCGYLWLTASRKAVLYVMLAVLSAQALSSGLKVAFDRPRPDLVPHGDYVYTQSFPSGHSLLSAATYLTLGAMLAENERKKRMRIFFVTCAVLLALLVGVSRVYLGVHWPTDVIGGGALGAAWALLFWAIVTYVGLVRQNSNAQLNGS